MYRSRRLLARTQRRNELILINTHHRATTSQINNVLDTSRSRCTSTYASGARNRRITHNLCARNAAINQRALMSESAYSAEIRGQGGRRLKKARGRKGHLVVMTVATFVERLSALLSGDTLGAFYEGRVLVIFVQRWRILCELFPQSVAGCIIRSIVEESFGETFIRIR